MTTENVPAIFTGSDESASAPAPLYDSIPAPQNEQQVAEIVAAADFLSRSDARMPETAQTAQEIFALLGPDHPFTTSLERGEGNFDLYADGDTPTGPARDAASGRFVPHSAMHQERARRKEAEAKLRETELRVAKTEERLNVLSELLNAAQNGQQHPQQYDPRQQQQPDLDAEIDPEVDVLAAVQQLQKKNSRLQAERDEQRFLENAKADIVKFTRQAPDFFDGVQHLVQSRDRELEIMGMADKEQRIRQIAMEEKVLMQQAFAEGRSPAERLYALARQRGFTGGRQPQVVTPDPRATRQIQQLQQNQQASATLSGAGGTSGSGLSVSQIADMSEHDFYNLINKLGGLNSPRVKSIFGS